SEAHSGKAATSEASAHGHHGVKDMRADIPCPHGPIPADIGPADIGQSADHSSHKTVGGGHCSACITLPPMLMTSDAGLAVRTAEKPGLSPHLDSAPPEPLERPPRIRG